MWVGGGGQEQSRSCGAGRGASPRAVVRSGLVGCVIRKCSQVGLQRLLGMSPARQPEACYITRGAGTSHLPAPQLSVSAPPARPETSCIPPTTHSPTPGLQLLVKRRVSLPAGGAGCGPSGTVAWWWGWRGGGRRVEWKPASSGQGGSTLSRAGRHLQEG